MKNCITLIALLVLTVPAFAQTVDITLTDNGGGSFTVGYARASEDIASVSMLVTLSGSDGVLADCNDAVAAAPFNFHMDYWNTIGGAPVLGEGCPVGDELLAGLPTFPASTFAIYTSVVADPPAGAPTQSGDIATITLTGNCGTFATLSADIAGRGGIIGVSGNELVVNFPKPLLVKIGSDCFPGCSGGPLAQQYADWVAFSKPDCWCEPYHCDGDATTSEQGLFAAKHRIGSSDIGTVIGNWKYKATTPGFNPCADVDHKPQGLFAARHRVGTNDLNLVVFNWQAKTRDLPGDCPRP